MLSVIFLMTKMLSIITLMMPMTSIITLITTMMSITTLKTMMTSLSSLWSLWWFCLTFTIKREDRVSRPNWSNSVIVYLLGTLLPSCKRSNVLDSRAFHTHPHRDQQKSSLIVSWCRKRRWHYRRNHNQFRCAWASQADGHWSVKEIIIKLMCKSPVLAVTTAIIKVTQDWVETNFVVKSNLLKY